MTNLYMGGEDLPDDYTDENGAEYSVEKEDKRMYENHKDHGQDMSYENEVTRDSSPYVRIQTGAPGSTAGLTFLELTNTTDAGGYANIRTDNSSLFLQHGYRCILK